MARKKHQPRELIAEREAALDRARADVATAFGDQWEQTGELTTVDQHPADQSDVLHDRELRETTQRIFEIEAAQLEDARERLARGEYGICAECGNKIPPERLEIRPGATLCVTCQSQREARAR